MRDVFIVDAVRTPIGEFGGTLSGLPATALGAIAVQGLLKKTKARPAAVDELIFGQVVAAGSGVSPGRVVAIHGGLPETIPAFTLNKACGSGMKAVLLGANAIAAEEAELVIAGGMESMSSAPFLVPKARFGYRLGNGELVDANIHDGLTSSFKHWPMGMAAELTAQKYRISRRAQDEFALRSHRLAVAAAKKKKFNREIIPIDLHPNKRKKIKFKTDERPRPATNLKKLASLSPAFKKGGTVTAGNAPGLNDGASCLMLASAEALERYKLKPKARIVGSAAIGLKPELIFVTPAKATEKVLKKCKMKLKDIDFIECNEAFAAEMLAVEKLLKWNRNRVNVYGGAIALGHPIGASGARILTTLLSVLHQEKGRFGLATICMGGGNGLAVVIEKA